MDGTVGVLALWQARHEARASVVPGQKSFKACKLSIGTCLCLTSDFSHMRVFCGLLLLV